MTDRPDFPPELPDSFWNKCDPDPSPVGCWVWSASTDGKAYGKLRWHGRDVLAHRLVYALCICPIPPGFDIDHLCGNALCVRPEHLEAVPPRENQRRKRREPSVETIRKRTEEVARIRARRAGRT